MEKPPIRIDEWSVVESAGVLAWRPLEPGYRLTGCVIDHGTLPNGQICTSPIVRVDEVAGIVETSNNVYRLGRRSEEYELWLRRQNPPRAA